MCLDLIDEDESDGSTQQRGGALPCRGRNPRTNVRAVEIQEELVRRQPPVTRAIELFSNECAAGLAVLHRLAIKQQLSSPTTAEFFLSICGLCCS